MHCIGIYESPPTFSLKSISLLTTKGKIAKYAKYIQKIKFSLRISQ